MSNQTEEMTEDQKFESDLLDDQAKTHIKLDETQKIVVALCERDRRCSTCYRYMSVSDRANCGGCEEYYCECNCTPLTPDQILNGEFT